jgi:hypothetical protein
LSNRKRRDALASGAVLIFAAGLIAFASAAGSAAASAPPTPLSLTTCAGSLSPDTAGAAVGEPYLLDYKFRCDGAISAYTIIVDRRATDTGNVDDFNPSPEVLASDGLTPSSNESLICEGAIPSNGINCNAGAGGVLTAGNFAVGSVDLVDAYCKHLPAKARPGTPAVPRALVQLVVTDVTGAEDGPFTLGLTKACPAVPKLVPASRPRRRAKDRRRA